MDKKYIYSHVYEVFNKNTTALNILGDIYVFIEKEKAEEKRNSLGKDFVCKRSRNMEKIEGDDLDSIENKGYFIA